MQGRYGVERTSVDEVKACKIEQPCHTFRRWCCCVGQVHRWGMAGRRGIGTPWRKHDKRPSQVYSDTGTQPCSVQQSNSCNPPGPGRQVPVCVAIVQLPGSFLPLSPVKPAPRLNYSRHRSSFMCRCPCLKDVCPPQPPCHCRSQCSPSGHGTPTACHTLSSGWVLFECYPFRCRVAQE